MNKPQPSYNLSDIIDYLKDKYVGLDSRNLRAWIYEFLKSECSLSDLPTHPLTDIKKYGTTDGELEALRYLVEEFGMDAKIRF